MEAGEELALEQRGVERRVARERGRAFPQARRLRRLEVLGLVAHRDPPRGRPPARGFHAGEHPDERRLPGRVRADDPDGLALRELPGRDGEVERGELLLERGELDERVRPAAGFGGWATNRIGSVRKRTFSSLR